MISKKEPKRPEDSAFAGYLGAAQPPPKKPAPSKPRREKADKGKDG